MTPASAAGLFLGAALLSSAALAVDGSAPPSWHASAELCVATPVDSQRCGPAQADRLADGTIRLRIDDIAYQLQLRSREVDVVLMHGTLQVDDFSAPFEWIGDVLRFVDIARGLRYEIRFPSGRPPAP
ncbi:MAG: hypothetical protein ABIQ60_03900 [Burkholderiaceae bacterium]